MKITSYLITTILLFSPSNAANKSITELGYVQIEDLFYNSELTLSPADIDKIGLNQVDKVLEENNDLDLESLEIEDIDLATFGEYETFLNKYYDDNFLHINSRFINQIEFISGGIIGQKIPIGGKGAFKNGINFGIRFNDIFNLKYKKLDFTTNIEISYDSNKFIKPPNADVDVNIINIEPSLSLNLIKNISLKSGLGLMSIKTVESSNGNILNEKFGLSSFIVLQYKINVYNNIHLTVFSKAKIEKHLTSNKAFSSRDELGYILFGIGAIMPIHLKY